MTDPDPYTELGGQPSTAPLPTTLRGCGQNPCLGHDDGHVCYWRTVGDDDLIPCGCTHAPAQKGRV